MFVQTIAFTKIILPVMVLAKRRLALDLITQVRFPVTNLTYIHQYLVQMQTIENVFSFKCH